MATDTTVVAEDTQAEVVGPEVVEETKTETETTTTTTTEVTPETAPTPDAPAAA